MKHKVKLVKVVNENIILKVDGALCEYLIQRPQPLSPVDAKMLRGVMDERFLSAMSHSLNASYTNWGFLRNLLYRLRGLGGAVLTYVVHADGRAFETFVKPGYVLKTFGESVADYIERVCVEVDISKKVKSFVLLKSDIDKIRKGEIYET